MGNEHLQVIATSEADADAQWSRLPTARRATYQQQRRAAATIAAGRM